jgi:hypothetical protein
MPGDHRASARSRAAQYPACPEATNSAGYVTFATMINRLAGSVFMIAKT